MVFRFANGIFEPLWNRDYIDHVQITVAETVGVETARRLLRRDRRAARHGAEPPVPAPRHDRDGAAELASTPTRVRDEKAKVLRRRASIRRRGRSRGTTWCAASTAPARSAASRCAGLSRGAGRGARTRAPRPIVAMKLGDRQLALGRRAVLPAHRQARWRRAAPRSRSSSSRRRSRCSATRRSSGCRRTILMLHIQPEEGVSLRFGAKVPGPAVRLGGVDDGLRLRRLFSGACPAPATRRCSTTA